MNAKPFKFMTRHIVPVILAVLLICFTSLCGYMEAYATDLPISGGWSGYDIIYTLLNSIGITISVQPDSDGTPPGYTAESYDAYMAEVEAALLQAQDNIDTGDTPVQQLIDELKALPSTIKDGCISVSQDLWNLLNNYVYEDIQTQVNVENYTLDVADCPYRYICSFTRTDENSPFFYGTNISSGSVRFVYSVTEESRGLCVFQYIVSSSPFSAYVMDSRDINNLYPYTYFPESSLSIRNGYYYITVCGFGSLSSYCALGNRIDSLYSYLDSLPANTVIESNAPDVIWPKTDLAYDIVNHVTTWDEAIANDVITTAEDDDTVAVIPLTDTAVGEDVYVDAGDIVIPGSSEAESEASSEATSEAESEKADELVDESVISTLPDKAAAAGDITKLFPFCIPFDIVSMVKGMKAAKKAPVWTFKYYFKDIDYTFEFTVDMTDYDKYIQIFRAGIVIFYVITLMLLTIRYSSGIVKD